MNSIQAFGKKNPAVPLYPAVRAGDFVFVSGQVPRNEAGELVTSTIEEATRTTLDAVKRALHAAGCELPDVVQMTVYLGDARDFGRFNEISKQYFPEGRMARSTVEARAVIDCKIEIDCVAYRPLDKK